ncbi:alpha/beta hydrolase [Paracoccus aurantiacus]|uniref:Alpha/beta hydrolase n=1 Tax=Paracoccus aurantiacus TaxID=2599412 RepID=A0A5C6S9R2_9RHOB|nr:alpha/beta fold hydrolase [Paracoccus aurantiacus]TXB71148.1 alpha/beta hydrolase [Paracoccus aurantiacus]
MKLNERHFPGDPERPAIGLHCMMGGTGLFQPLMAHLGGLVDLRSFDFPGHGRSPDWPGGDDPDLHSFVTRHAAAMIQRPLDLIGHSFGATVALRIAVGAPQAVRSLTLVEPVLFAAASPATRQAENDRLAPFEAAGDIDGMLHQFLSDWGAPGGEIPTEGPRLERLRKQMRMVVDTNRALMQDRSDILRAGGLEGIDAPVMLIAGAQSPPIVHEIAEALAARLPDVGRATVPGAGHMLPLTHAEQFADLTRMNLERS